MYQSPSPLRDALSDFDKRETDHMENLRDSLEATANKSASPEGKVRAGKQVITGYILHRKS